MLLIVMLVLFVMVMFLWMLALLGALAVGTLWLPFFACVILGVAVFLGVGHISIPK